VKTRTLETDLWLPRPLHEVFAFFSDASNLNALTPPWLHFQIESPQPLTMGQGTRIDYRLRLHGVPLRWRTEITVWEPPHRFVDTQREGPYRRWVHEHTFTEQDGGTRIRDRVTYVVGGGLLEPLVHRLLVGPDLRKIFAYRQQQLQERFAAMLRMVGSAGVALILLCPSLGSAHGLPLRGRSVAVSYYPAVSVVAYDPMPIWVVAPLLVCPPLPAAAPLAPGFAVPVPAPPSSVPAPVPPTPAPSPGNSGAPSQPKVTESRALYYDAFSVATQGSEKPSGESCSVAFWNLTGRDVTLKLDGQAQTLPRGQRLTRSPAREFVWQIDGREPHTQRVPLGEVGLEIVIRQ
jgi:ligand-binding SRPBCC domain-containing protein